MGKKQVARAILTIKNPGMMTPTGLEEIATWLRKEANGLLKQGDAYSKSKFTARLFF